MTRRVPGANGRVEYRGMHSVHVLYSRATVNNDPSIHEYTNIRSIKLLYFRPPHVHTRGTLLVESLEWP